MSISPNSTVFFTGGSPQHFGRHATVIGAYISDFYVPELGLDTRGEILLAVRFLDNAGEVATDVPETDVEVTDAPDVCGVPLYLAPDVVEALYALERGCFDVRMTSEAVAFFTHPSNRYRSERIA